MNVPPSRRGLLKRLAFLTVGGGSAVAAAAASAEPHPDAELLALGADLDQATARYRDLNEALVQAKAHFEAIEPPIPDDLKMHGFPSWVSVELPPNHLGWHRASSESGKIRIPNRQSLNKQVKELDGRTVTGRRARRLKRLSDAYYEAHAAARQEAGTNEADWARYDQGRAIAALVVKTDAVRASTLAGLAVKARAQLAWLAVLRDEGCDRQSPSIVALLENLAALGPAT